MITPKKEADRQKTVKVPLSIRIFSYFCFFLFLVRRLPFKSFRSPFIPKEEYSNRAGAAMGSDDGADIKYGNFLYPGKPLK